MRAKSGFYDLTGHASAWNTSIKYTVQLPLATKMLVLLCSDGMLAKTSKPRSAPWMFGQAELARMVSSCEVPRCMAKKQDKGFCTTKSWVRIASHISNGLNCLNSLTKGLFHLIRRVLRSSCLQATYCRIGLNSSMISCNLVRSILCNQHIQILHSSFPLSCQPQDDHISFSFQWSSLNKKVVPWHWYAMISPCSQPHTNV